MGDSKEINSIQKAEEKEKWRAYVHKTLSDVVAYVRGDEKDRTKTTHEIDLILGLQYFIDDLKAENGHLREQRDDKYREASGWKTAQLKAAEERDAYKKENDEVVRQSGALERKLSDAEGILRELEGDPEMFDDIRWFDDKDAADDPPMRLGRLLRAKCAEAGISLDPTTPDSGATPAKQDSAGGCGSGLVRDPNGCEECMECGGTGYVSGDTPKQDSGVTACTELPDCKCSECVAESDADEYAAIYGDVRCGECSGEH